MYIAGEHERKGYMLLCIISSLGNQVKNKCKCNALNNHICMIHKRIHDSLKIFAVFDIFITLFWLENVRLQDVYRVFCRILLFWSIWSHFSFWFWWSFVVWSFYRYFCYLLCLICGVVLSIRCVFILCWYVNLVVKRKVVVNIIHR